MPLEKNKKPTQASQQLESANKKKTLRLPLYFGWEIDIFVQRIQNLREHILGPFKSYRTYFIAVIIVIILVSTTLFFRHDVPSLAATYNWLQTDWSGGASVTTAAHPTHQLNWTNYTSKDTTLAAGSDLTLGLSVATTTETSDTDFNAGTASNTTVSGSGSGASIILSTGAISTASWSDSETSAYELLHSSHSISNILYADSKAYIWDYTDKSLDVFNVSDPTNPILLGSSAAFMDTTTSNPHMIISGSYIYVDTGPSVRILNISNPASITTASSVNKVTGFLDGQSKFTLSGTTLFVPANNTQVSIYSVSDPTSPVPLSTYTSTGNSSLHGMVASGNYLYVSTFGTDCEDFPCFEWGGVDVVNVTNPSSPSYVTTLPFYAGKLIIHNAYLYAIENTYRTTIKVYSLSNPASPSFIRNVSPGFDMKDMELAEEHIFVAGGTGNVSIYHLTDPSNPTLVGSMNSSTRFTLNRSGTDYLARIDTAQNVYPCGTYLCITNQIIRYTKPGNQVIDTFLGVLLVPIRGYASSGTFTSQALDTTGNVGFTNINWTATTPADTALTVKTRTAATADMSGATDWTSCPTLTNNQDISSAVCITSGHRYVQYQLSLTSSNPTNSPSLSDISIGKTAYPNSATLTSSAYNAGDPSNIVGGLQWSATKPANTNIKFQIRTAPDANGAPGTWSDFLGPTDANDYYVDNTGGETTNAVHRDGANDQWMQYKVWLESTSGLATPTLSDATLIYVVNATPSFLESPTADQESDGTVTISYTIRDTDTTTGQPENRGYVTPSFEYSINNGGDWNAITTGLSAGATDRKAVEEVDYHTYTASWDAKEQIDGIFAAETRIRVTINDGEGANNTASAASASFALDVKDPIAGDPAISISATSTPALLTLSANDDSTLQVQVSLTSDFTGAGWEDYAASKTITLATDPDIVYVRFRDAFGNTTTAQSAQTTETPLYPIVRDVSNNLGPTYQLFVSWKAIAAPTAGFGAYYIWRSTDNGETFTMVRTVTDRTLNYYLDTNLNSTTSYLYKISALDADGNGSFFSTEVSDTPDGQGGTDTTPPTISNVAIGSITTQSARITWDTNELSDSTVGYSTTAGNFATEVGLSTMVNNAAGVGQHILTLTGLTPNTTYYLQAQSTDPEGNADTDNNGGDGYTFTTLAGPTISNVSASQIQNTQAIITWQTDQASNSSVVYSMNSDLSQPSTELVANDSVTNHAVTLTGLTQGTTYYYYVASGVASDTNGGSYYSFTTTLDGVAPVITSVAADPVTDTQALISWLTNERADSRVWFGTATGLYASSTTQDANFGTSHAMLLSSLATATKYYYVVVSSDPSGNTATSTESNFTTQSSLSTEEEVIAREEIARQAGVVQGRTSSTSSSGGGGGGSVSDTQAPTILNIKAQDITSNSARVTWTTNEIANSFVQFGRSTNYGELHGVWEYATNHSVVLDHLVPGVTYHYRVASADKAGNVQTSANLTLETTGGTGEDVTVEECQEPETNSDVINAVKNTAELIGDLASSVSIQVLETSLSLQQELIDRFSPRIPGPLISGEPRVSLTATTAEVSWTTDKEASSLVAFAAADSYQPSADNPYLSTVGDVDARTTKHTVLLTGLTPDTVYNYQIQSKTPVSSLVKSSNFTFRTLRKSLEITNYTLEKVAEDTVVFRWATNSDASSELRITPYRNGARSTDETLTRTTEGFTTIHQIEITNLESGTLYDVDLVSKDTSGTEATKTIYAFSTSLENTPPVISHIKTESALSPGKDPKVQTIISWTTNEASTSRVYYQEGIGTSLDDLSESTSLDPAFTRKHIVVLTSFKPGIVYRFRVESTDSTGLTTLSSIHTILAPRQTESVFQIIVKNIESTFGWVRGFRS